MPANTAVLKRTTNQAEIYYFFDDVQVLDGNLHFQEREPEEYIPEPSSNAPPLIVTMLISPVIAGVVSAVAGKIALAALAHVIRNLPPQYQAIKSFFAEDYTELTKTIKSELAAEFITQIDGRVQGTLQWISNSYLPRKESIKDLTKKENRQELFELVNQYNNLFYTEVIAQLMHPEHSKLGLSVFALAGSVHLALNQELALVDPAVSDPNQSSFAKTVSLNAIEYKNFVSQTLNEVILERDQAVIIAQSIPATVMNCTEMWYWYDTITNDSGTYCYPKLKNSKPVDPLSKDIAQGQRATRATQVCYQLRETLSAADKAVKEWSCLVTQPIPIPSSNTLME